MTLQLAEPGFDPRHRLGVSGEQAAERLLGSRGLIVLERRWRARVGEIDLVVEDGESVVFVEVKTRSGTGWGGPSAAVTPAKQRRLARAASAYLVTRGWSDRPCRFDVVEVLSAGSGEPVVRHIPDAFRPGGRGAGRRSLG